MLKVIVKSLILSALVFMSSGNQRPDLNLGPSDYFNKESSIPKIPQINKLSYNTLCRSISFTQTDKNLCLLNFGFKDSQRPPIRIAIVDTGIDKNHPFLKNYIAHTGYDLTKKKANAFHDVSGHGTHVAGIIVQQIESLSDMTQTIIPFELVSVKYTDFGHDFSLGPAINYVITHEKIDILNISSYGDTFDDDEMLALKNAEAQQIQVVAASGNESKSLDTYKTRGFPCSFNMDNIICVANLTSEGKISATSNFGSKIDTATLGTNVMSTIPGNNWKALSGSSMAVPRITALMAYAKAINNKKSFYHKTDIIKLNDPLITLNGKAKGGILDFQKIVSQIPLFE